MVILLMIRTVSDQKIKIMKWKQVSIRFWNTRSSQRFYNWPFLLVRVLIRSPALHSVTFYQLQIPSQHFHFVCSTYLMIAPVSVPDPASKTPPFPQMLQQCPVTVCQVICNIYPDLSGHGMEQVTQQTMTLSVLRMTHRDKIPAFPAQLWPLSSAFMIITAQREEIIEKIILNADVAVAVGVFHRLQMIDSLFSSVALYPFFMKVDGWLQLRFFSDVIIMSDHHTTEAVYILLNWINIDLMTSYDVTSLSRMIFGFKTYLSFQ